MVQQVQITMETGETEFLLADLIKEMQDFIKEKDFEIISCFKIRKSKKRTKDVN